VIKKIRLANFRNYAQQEIKTGPATNIIYGDNAQGKTNILEAVYLCVCARSHRTAKDMDLIRHEQDHYKVQLEFTSKNGSDETIEIRYLAPVPGDVQRQKHQRLIFHNGIRLDKIADLMGLFHAVIFAPEDLNLVKEGPATRRRYLDLLISQVRPSYFQDLQQYSRILGQRNKMLKDLREQGFSRHKSLDEMNLLQLEVWNEALARTGASLIWQRIIFCRRIEEIASEMQKNLSNEKEKLYVRYKTIGKMDDNCTVSQLEDSFRKRLKTMLYEDIERGITNSGTHRDDLELSLDGANIRLFASQGQQRSTVLSLKIAELRILEEETGELPVLLLDDVMSELDESRRLKLLENIQSAQVFVTCTDLAQIFKQKGDGLLASYARRWQNASYLHVEEGQVREETIQD
ncbi:MAG: DNA replication/repair protein RecF, partial [Deltaproteobacteria bacterium]|nr:DNA replication/repair protein RecF [Deltaproteobacteria bacterium]